MKAKIRTCPFDQEPCQLDCPDRHPDRSGCPLTDALDSGKNVLAYNHPTGEIVLFRPDGGFKDMPAIIAGCSREDMDRLFGRL